MEMLIVWGVGIPGFPMDSAFPVLAKLAALIWKGRQALIERLCLILGEKVWCGLQGGMAVCRDGVEQCLEVGVQPAPQKAGEAGGKRSKEITPEEVSHTQNLGGTETRAVPVW